MIKFDEKIVGVWFLSTTAEQDWMAALSEVAPGKYELNYRFRYYDPESKDPWDGKDRKNWYKGTIESSREEAIDGIRKVGTAMVVFGAVGELYEVLNDNGFEKFLEEFQAQPWVFARKEAKPEGVEDFKEFMKSIGADDGSPV